MKSSQLFSDLAECLGWKSNASNQFQLAAYEDVIQFLGFLNINMSDDVFNLEITAQKKVKNWKFNVITLAEKINLAKELDLLIPGFGAELKLGIDLINFNAVYMRHNRNDI